MTRRLAIGGALCFALLLTALGWALQPATEYWTRSPRGLLIDQLGGRGCQYQPGRHTVNPFTTWSIRHPEQMCPIWAGEQLAAMKLEFNASERLRVLAAFDAAIRLQPASFDTGDGVIEYARELRQARDAIATPETDSRGRE